MGERRTRHILSISGGKDSAALAIYLKDRVAGLEYVFCDTEKELPETYDYLNRLEAYLDRPIERLTNHGRGFDHYLAIYRGYLPSAQSRWCTKHLKIEPFERYVGEDQTYLYVGIRADEQRKGYLPTKPNIVPVFPFQEDGIALRHVLRILDASGLGLPGYSRWRSRSGCFFCFFQQKIEWVGLLENHPELFEEASRYEKVSSESGKRYTWSDGESLEELANPRRVCQIKREHADRVPSGEENTSNSSLMEVLLRADLL